MKMYNATIEVEHRGEPDVDHVMTALQAFHPAVGVSARGWAFATITLPGEDLQQASAAAAAVVQAAFDAPLLLLEVTTTDEFDARQGWAPVPELVSVTEAAQLLGVSRQRILQRIADRTLPGEKIGRDYAIPRGAVTPADRS